MHLTQQCCILVRGNVKDETLVMKTHLRTTGDHYLIHVWTCILFTSVVEFVTALSSVSWRSDTAASLHTCWDVGFLVDSRPICACCVAMCRKMKY